ncbi:MAG: multiheme c-type cytochrome [Gemmataceae bacterium]
MDETRPTEMTTPDAAPASAGRGRVIAVAAAALALTVASGYAGVGLARWLKSACLGTPTATAPAFPGGLFRDWKKPDLVVVVTAEMHGYVLPCGCSRPQVGGLERRYNLLQLFKKAGWPYAAVDVGDMAQNHGPASLPNQQALIKYLYTMRALKAMDYTAVGFGQVEAGQGLFTLLAEYALQDPKPRVLAANLIDAATNFPEMTQPLETVTPAGSGIRVGVTAMVGPAVATRMKGLDKTLKFERTTDALDRVLKQMAADRVQLPILLYQGTVQGEGTAKPSGEPVACAEAYPQIPIIACLSSGDEPPARPVEVATARGKSLVISLGHKGKFVGVVGVWKTGDPQRPFDLRYERVELTEEFLTSADARPKHAIAELMETYTLDLKNQNYLEKYGQVSHALQVLPPVAGLDKNVPVSYVGSETCKKCHKKSYEIWKKTPHSHAYQTLADATAPSNRQFDPECIVCHTIGFGQQSGFVTEARTPQLKNVGCESCHGPASMHVANPNDPEWQKRINPWKYLPATSRTAAIDQFCQKCHDIDNDVTWIHNAFPKKWAKIDHKESE